MKPYSVHPLLLFLLGLFFSFSLIVCLFSLSSPSLSLCLFPSLPLIDIVSVCVAGSLWMGWRCPGQTFASAATEWLNTRETNTTSPTHRGTASLSKLVLWLYIRIDCTAFVSQLHTPDISLQLFHLHLRELWLCGAAKGILSITCPCN